MDRNAELVERILRLSRDPAKVNFRAPLSHFAESDDPVGPDVVEAAEEALGFPLPPLLRELYLQVGNGGFGPGYGIIGLEGGYREDLSEACLPELYLYYREEEDDERERWPEKLLPLFVVGCGLVDSVDCSAPEYPIVKGVDHGFEYTGIPFYDWMEIWVRSLEAQRP